jgi:copper resistance protein C
VIRRVLRAAALAALCGLALLLGAGVASAHSRLVSSNPADGSNLATSPQRVSLTFNEQVQADFTALTVVGPDGAQYQSGDVTANGATISVGVKPLGPAGKYQIGYRVISDDGHPVAGSVSFTLTAPGPAAAAATAAATAPTTAAAPAPVVNAAPPAAAEGGAPVWPWIAGAVVLVIAGVIAALRLGRG